MIEEHLAIPFSTTILGVAGAENKKEMGVLRSISSRAEITSTRNASKYLSISLSGSPLRSPQPEVPAGLDRLSAALNALADFLDLDENLIEVAAETSACDPPAPADTDLAEWLGKLPEAGKDELLIRAATGRSADVGAEVLRRFHQQRAGNANAPTPPRTVEAVEPFPPTSRSLEMESACIRSRIGHASSKGARRSALTATQVGRLFLHRASQKRVDPGLISPTL